MTKTVYFNGTILTLEDARPTAEALGVVGDRIASIGTLDEVRAAVGAGAEQIDLRGRTLIPGFNDDHLHLLSMGDYFARPHLGGLTCEEVIERMRDFYRGAQPGEVLYGQGWDYPHCVNPHRAMLDRAFPNNPVVLFQYSGHGSWVSTSMLKRMKVARGTPDPLGGRIERDEAGEPTGILLDAAARPAHIQKTLRQVRDPAVRTVLLERALALLRENGITTAQDNTWYPEVVSALRKLEDEGRLTLRVSCWSDGRAPLRRYRLDHMRFDEPHGERLAGQSVARAERSAPAATGAAGAAAAGAAGNGRDGSNGNHHGALRARGLVTRGPVKYFLDGTFSTRTAWLTEPYVGEPGNVGLPMGSTEWAYGLVERNAARLRQAAFHAIGDRAVQELVDGVEAARKRHPWVRSLRMRIEHGQLIRRADMERIRELGMVVSAQPTALIAPEKDRRILGADRAARAYPYRSLLAAEVPLAFGSDVPGESTFAPIGAIHDIVNRESDERIGPLEALRCYTLGSAYAEFQEREKGTLAPGKLADLAVLSANPLEVPREKIREITVEMTVVGGRIVFESEAIRGRTPEHRAAR